MTPTIAVPVEIADAPYLTCITCNYFAMLQALGVRQLRPHFGQQFYFSTDALLCADQSWTYTFDHARLEESIEAWSGWRAVESVARDGADLLVRIGDALTKGYPILLYGDGARMAWTPFFRHEPVEHTFVVTQLNLQRDEAAIIDTYVNNTKYGRAQPFSGTVPASQIPWLASNAPGHRDFHCVHFVPCGTETDIGPDSIRQIMRRSTAMYRTAIAESRGLTALAGKLEESAAAQDLVEKLSLLFWLGVRAREYFTLWLQDVSVTLADPRLTSAVEFAKGEVVPLWRKLNEVAYIVARRAESGNASLTAVVQLLQRLAAGEEALLDRLAGG